MTFQHFWILLEKYFKVYLETLNLFRLNAVFMIYIRLGMIQAILYVFIIKKREYSHILGQFYNAANWLACLYNYKLSNIIGLFRYFLPWYLKDSSK